MRFPVLARFALLGAVALGLLIPLALIRDKVAERRDRAADVRKSFAEETSGPQTLAGPFLALTCEETYTEERTVHQANGKPRTVRETKQRPCPTALFLPRELRVAGTLPVEERYRGIYPIRLYLAKLALWGAFDVPLPAENSRVWKEAFLVLAIGDVRGIKEAPAARIGASNVEWRAGTLDTRIKSGLHAPLGAHADLEDLSFQIALEVAGTGRLDIAPLGGQSEVSLASSWPHPSFVGAYSPERRDIDAHGFAARWRANHLATGGNAFWLQAARENLFGNARLLGVALVEPVNPYSMAYRATEYGFLFILLTFAAFALVELVWRVRLHPMQYALTGLALAVFFLLLIALSEHIRFGWAYLAAAACCVALLTFYLRHPLGRPRTALFGVLFATLYGALYVLLRSEDHALLLGSALVFGVLAAVMVLTRKLDWTDLSGRLREPLAHAP
jgi:inner membrane protein